MWEARSARTAAVASDGGRWRVWDGSPARAPGRRMHLWRSLVNADDRRRWARLDSRYAVPGPALHQNSGTVAGEAFNAFVAKPCDARRRTFARRRSAKRSAAWHRERRHCIAMRSERLLVR